MKVVSCANMEKKPSDLRSRPVLQIGVAKSGNFWLYKVLAGLLNAAGVPDRSFIKSHPIWDEAQHWRLSFPEQASIDVIDVTPHGYVTRISSRFEEAISDLDTFLVRSRHAWSHAPFRPGLSEPLLERTAPAIYIVRDPRDVLVSQADFAFTEYMRAHFPNPHVDADAYLSARCDEFPIHWRSHVASYVEAAQRGLAYFVFYEKLLADLPGEMRTLAQALELDVDDNAIETLADALSFSSLRKGREGHVNKGVMGRWRKRLTTEENDLFLGQSGDLIRLLGYPEKPDDAMKNLPRFPDRQALAASGLGAAN